MYMVPVVCNVHHPRCGETQHNSTQQLTDTLEQVSSDVAPPATENYCDCIDTLFTENPQLKALMRIPHLLYKSFNSRQLMNANNYKLHQSVSH